MGTAAPVCFAPTAGELPSVTGPTTGNDQGTFASLLLQLQSASCAVGDIAGTLAAENAVTTGDGKKEEEAGVDAITASIVATLGLIAASPDLQRTAAVAASGVPAHDQEPAPVSVVAEGIKRAGGTSGRVSQAPAAAISDPTGAAPLEQLPRLAMPSELASSTEVALLTNDGDATAQQIPAAEDASALKNEVLASGEQAASSVLKTTEPSSHRVEQPPVVIMDTRPVNPTNYHTVAGPPTIQSASVTGGPSRPPQNEPAEKPETTGKARIRAGQVSGKTGWAPSGTHTGVDLNSVDLRSVIVSQPGIADKDSVMHKPDEPQLTAVPSLPDSSLPGKTATDDAQPHDASDAKSVKPAPFAATSETTHRDNGEDGVPTASFSREAASAAQSLATIVPDALAPQPLSREASVAQPDGGGQKLPVTASTGFGNAERELPPLATGTVQTAHLLERMGQSEIHIGMRTPAFGTVEVHTTVRDSQIGLTIGSERGDLHSLLAPDVPGLEATFRHHDLQLSGVKFLEHAGGLDAGLSSGTHQDPRNSPYFQPPARWQRGVSPLLEASSEIVPAISKRAGLNVHA